MTQVRTVTLIDALQDPGRYPHPVDRITVIETHISWVVLTGPFAYKIKKPVDLGFLDFSTLERRRFYCQEELRLNRRLAPRLYRAVIAIGGPAEDPVLGADTDIIEYAVQMVQFDQADRLDHRLEQGRLEAGQIDALAEELARFHGQAAIAPADSDYGSAKAVRRPVFENFEQIEPRLSGARERTRLARLLRWSEREAGELEPVFTQRRAESRVRECHGDAHLANMVWYQGEVLLFDCLEFDPELRWIDVMSELAFAIMDLQARGQAEFGRRLLDRYLQQTGDYGGLRVLRFYQCYRALVRAKVEAIRRSQDKNAMTSQPDTPDPCLAYIDLAGSYMKTPSPALIITCGVSGSGKTVATDRLVEELPVIRIRSDVERKRLFGFAPAERTGTEATSTVYGPEAGRRTYERLRNLAREIVGAGYPVVVDATFLRALWREEFRQLAADLDIPFLILKFHAPIPVLRQRVADRLRRRQDASEAGLEVLEKQLGEWEELTPDEKKHAFSLDTSDSEAPAQLLRHLRGILREDPPGHTYI